MRIIKRWLPLILWVVFIFWFSSIPAFSNGGFSLPWGSDKVIHFIEYSVLAILLYRGLGYGKVSPGKLTAAVSLVVAGGIALMDEYYQSFVPGRDASFLDLAADYSGVAAGVAISYFRRRNIRGRTL